MAKLHVCLQISYMSIADSWFLFNITTSVDVGFASFSMGFPWSFPVGPDRLVEPCQEFFMGCLRLGGNARGLELGKVLQDVWLGGRWRSLEIHGFPVKWSQKTWLFHVVSIYLYLYYNLYIYIYVCIYIYRYMCMYTYIYIYMYIIDRILLWFKAFQRLWMAPFSVDRIFSGGNIYFMGNMVTAFFPILTAWQLWRRWQDQQWLIRSQGKFQNFVETELSQINEAVTHDWERVPYAPNGFGRKLDEVSKVGHDWPIGRVEGLVYIFFAAEHVSEAFLMRHLGWWWGVIGTMIVDSLRWRWRERERERER